MANQLQQQQHQRHQKQDDFDRIAREARKFRDSEKKRIQEERLEKQQERQRRKKQEYERITQQYIRYMNEQRQEINHLRKELDQLLTQSRGDGCGRTSDDQEQGHDLGTNDGHGNASSPSSMSSKNDTTFTFSSLLPPSSPSYVAERTAQLQQQLEDVEKRLQVEKERYERHEQQKNSYEQKYLQSQTSSAAGDGTFETTDKQATQGNNNVHSQDEENCPNGTHRLSGTAADAATSTPKTSTTSAPLVDIKGIIQDIDTTASSFSSSSVVTPLLLSPLSSSSWKKKKKNSRTTSSKNNNVGCSRTPEQQQQQPQRLVQVEEGVHDRISQSDEELAKAFDDVDDQLRRANLRMFLTRSDSEDEDRLAEQKYGLLMERELSVSIDDDDDTDGDHDQTNDNTDALLVSSEYTDTEDAPVGVALTPATATFTAPSSTTPNDSSSVTMSNDDGRNKQHVESMNIKESIRRTQEMLNEDEDLVGRNNRFDSSYNNEQHQQQGNDRESTTGDRSKNNIRSLMLHQYTGQSRPHSKTKSTKNENTEDDDDKGQDYENIITKTAIFEMPVELTEEGFQFSPKVADLSMATTIPPSRLGGRLSGTLEGKSSFGSVTKTSGGGMFSLEYITSKFTRLTIGTIRGGEPYSPLITLGGRFVKKGSSFGITFYNQFTSLQRLSFDTIKYSLSFRHSFPESKWFLSSSLSQKQDISMVVSNNKLSTRIGVNIWDPSRMMLLRVDAKPKLSEYRRAHCYCQWRTGIWQFGVSLVQSLQSDIATVGLGWRLMSSRGVEWVISWTRGSSTVRIPILVSKNLVGASFGHILYCTFISHIIQDGIAELWAWTSSDRAKPVESADRSADNAAIISMSKSKERKDAELQVSLMKRQAMRKAKSEAERDGLVIQKAIYKVEGGDEWEVTVPIQFWVSHSSLTLPRGSKMSLLGFYDITESATKKVKSESKQTSDSITSWWSSRLGSVWNDLLDIPSSKGVQTDSMKRQGDKTRHVPTLTVEYMFRGKVYKLCIKDNEELILPSPNATK